MAEAFAAAAPPTPGDFAPSAVAAAVDSRLRELMPGAHAAAIAVPATDAPADALPSADGSQFGLPARRGAAALRISRQELDARVQQILGKHGQGSLATPGGR
mmetsp:Transcript_37133/g.98326  ORF Transcript_37133/g.98326 Transcript_37133/m.98326 type:complete len:102 (+) Transcript_37133:1-306(+)